VLSRSVAISLLIVGASLSGGCNKMCCNTHDYDYAAYGGCRERVNPTRGRVASINDTALVVFEDEMSQDLPPDDEYSYEVLESDLPIELQEAELIPPPARDF